VAPLEAMMKIEIVTHYDKDDPEYGGDYHNVEVFVGGVIAGEWGDYYHDKGDLCAEAFVAGIKYALKGRKISVRYIEKADVGY
jgi:hypothetical protein